MSEKLIRSLYEGRLKTWAAARLPALTVAWENVTMTPPTSAYLRAFLLRGDTTSRDLYGDNRHRVGVFQINIVCPGGAGPGAAEGIAAELDALFPMNLILTSGAFSVTQVTPLRTRPGIPDDRYTVPVDFAYRADTY
jgi:hypothetical protein